MRVRPVTDLRRRRWLQAGFATSLLAGCGGGGGGGGGGSGTDGTSGPTAGGGSITQASVKRSSTGDLYDLFVYSPPVGSAPAAPLPLLVVLDGETWISTVASVLDTLRVRVHVLAIGRHDLRNRDFLMPGADDFLDFIARELLPWFEASHAVRTDRRVLIGHSYGGVFTGYAFLADRLGANRFWATLSMEGTFLYTDPTRLTMDAIASVESTLDTQGMAPATLLLSASGNAPLVQAYYNALVSHAYAGLTVKTSLYPQDHLGMFLPAFTDGISRLFTA